MKLSSTRPLEFGKDARGFTLPEVLITIAIMGILAAIAIPSWFGVVESRNVDAATNQLASDLRLAHTRSTNQLVDWGVATDLSSFTGPTFPAGIPSADYYLVRIPSSGVVTLQDVIGRNLPDEGAGVEIDSSTSLAVKFHPEGDAQIIGANPVQVHAAGEPYDSNPKHNIEVNPVTSRVKIDP